MHWQALGFSANCLGVSISFSQLCDMHFIYKLSQLLQSLQIEPANILLEIKGVSPLPPQDKLKKSFNMLKYVGVRMALDEIGVAAYPLDYLKTLPIQYLKLSPNFMDDLPHNMQTQKLLKAILFLGATLSLEIIATGVTSKEQLEFLKKAGCHLMQGKFLGIPLSAEEVESKMVGVYSS